MEFEPATVVRGGTAALICSRDMQGAPLYSVKWYRGNHEFYRFTPMEETATRMNRSNGSQVLLRKMDLGLAGNFSCEVTADMPPFATQIATKFIDIIGELLRANCTSPPARPAANLTIFVNEEPVRATETSLHPSDSGLFTTKVNVELKVTPHLFPSGRMRVACYATMYNVFNKSAKLDFLTPETDPRPERNKFTFILFIYLGTVIFILSIK
ncbi:unnamed protein product, partial [Leptidea sinapis]